MQSKFTNIVVVGQGAIGLLWYHHLSQARYHLNTEVTLLASNHALLSQSNITSAKYQFTPYQQEHGQYYPLIYSQPSHIKAADIIILCLKSYNITEAVKEIVKNLSPHCIVILAHNGLGTVDEVINLLPKEQRIVAMLITHGCMRNAPLIITHTGLGQSDIGLLSGKLNVAQQEQLVHQLNHALPNVTFHESILLKQWIKLAINCVINPITAIHNINNGLVSSEQFSTQVNAILTEIIDVHEAEINKTDVCKTEGYKIKETELILSDLQLLVYSVAQATSKNSSSMRCDVLAGKITEVDYINGYIHRLGKKHNIATPENTRLWQQIKALT